MEGAAAGAGGGSEKFVFVDPALLGITIPKRNSNTKRKSILKTSSKNLNNSELEALIRAHDPGIVSNRLSKSHEKFAALIMAEALQSLNNSNMNYVGSIIIKRKENNKNIEEKYNRIDIEKFEALSEKVRKYAREYLNQVFAPNVDEEIKKQFFSDIMKVIDSKLSVMHPSTETREGSHNFKNISEEDENNNKPVNLPRWPFEIRVGELGSKEFRNKNLPQFEKTENQGGKGRKTRRRKRRLRK